MDSFVADFMKSVSEKNSAEKEFLQAVEEVVTSVVPVFEKHPHYRKAKVLERMVEPERTIVFRVPWIDDMGEVQVNRGYRVEFSSVIGPFKGGLRFHSSVNLGILKFLGFEQILKNSLTTLPMGAGKGGSDFDPNGKSENEVMKFCQSFMTELFRHIGPHTDIPAGDVGVGSREIGFLFGQYKRLTSKFEGVLTGKALAWGGSRIRPEATGYGNVYFANEMLNTKNNSFEGKTVVVSGFGNVAWGSIKKANDMGAKVVTISGPDGYIFDPDGIKGEKNDFMLEMRKAGSDSVKDYADKFGVEFIPGKKPWEVKADIALPCAIQNELDGNDAKSLAENGCCCVSEGANMPCTPEAVQTFRENDILFGPGKASNAGGVATSGLEMRQNAMLMNWSETNVDNRLHQIMKNIHRNCLDTAEQYGKEGDYVVGANIAGFMKVAEGIIDMGVV